MSSGATKKQKILIFVGTNRQHKNIQLAWHKTGWFYSYVSEVHYDECMASQFSTACRLVHAFLTPVVCILG